MPKSAAPVKPQIAPRQSRPVRFPGVAAAAKQLGCSKAHLWAVLAGQRVSHRLSRRYAQLPTSPLKP